MKIHALPPNDSHAIKTALWLGFGQNATLSLQLALQQVVGQSVSAPLLIAFNATVLLCFVTTAAFLRGHWHYFKTAYPKQQFLRCSLRVIANATGMWALLHMPLTNNIVMGFMAPLAVAMLTPLILKEPLLRRALVSVALGLAGMFIILTVERAPLLPMLLAFVSVTIGSLNGILVRTMPRDHPFTFMVFTNLFLAVVFWPFAIPDIAKLTVPLVINLGWVALLSSFSSYAYFRSNLLASPQYTAPLQYTQLVWGALLGWAIWNHVPPAGFWAGAVLIIAGSAFLLPRRARAATPEAVDTAAVPPSAPAAAEPELPKI